MKKAIFPFIAAVILFAVVPAHGFLLNESVGGTATALGGVVLDKDMGAFDALYNPSYISSSFTNDQRLVAGASGALSPYGLQGIDNAAFGAIYGINLGIIRAGCGLGGQFDFVQNGISERRFYLSGSATYSDWKKMAEILGFIDSASLGLNLKLVNLHVDADLSSISGYRNDPIAFDFDVDLTVSFFSNFFVMGLMGSDILQTRASFVDNSVQTNDTRGLFAHGRINLVKGFSIFGAVNLLGAQHLVDQQNFLGSALTFANTYFGIEASFQAIYVRVGLNEGRLTGGLGIDVDYLTVNIGVLPNTTLNLYYQLDVNVKIF